MAQSRELPLSNMLIGLKFGSSFFIKLYLDVIYQGAI